jgi:hypothetical protein
MIGTLPAESLALATGIFTKKPPTASDLQRATKIENKVSMALKRFLKGEKPERWEAWQRPIGQTELYEEITTDLDIEDFDDLQMDVLVPQWVAVVTGVKHFLKTKWPLFPAEGLLPTNFDLATDEYFDVWELVRSVDGIENFLADLESYVLTREQVEAFQTVYPDFYERILWHLNDQLEDFLIKKKTVSWQQEDMIRILQGRPDEEPILIESQQAQQQPPAPTSPNKRADETRTRTETIESKEMR